MSRNNRPILQLKKLTCELRYTAAKGILLFIEVGCNCICQNYTNMDITELTLG